MDKVKGEDAGFTRLTESQWHDIEEEFVKEKEKNIAPFTYKPFVKKGTKMIVLITCLVVVIVGLCILSAVITQLPAYKSFMDLIRIEDLTSEQEQQAISFGTNVLLYFGLGALIVAGLAVAAGFILRKIKICIDLKKYESEKSTAHANWEEAKKISLQTAREQVSYCFCRFCGGKITRSEKEPKKSAYYETVYDVTNATVYGTATITPRDVAHEYFDYSEAYVRCGCYVCGYEIVETYGQYGTPKYVNVNIKPKARVTVAEVEAGNLYRKIKG